MFRIFLLLVILAAANDGRYSRRKISKSQMEGNLLSSIPERLTKPESGIEVLPLEVRETRVLLMRNNLRSYSLVSKITEKIIYQRYIEGLWPRRDTSGHSKSFLIALLNNPPSHCKPLDRETKVGLFHCPI